MKKIIVLAALLAVSCCAYCQQKKDTVRKSSVKVEKVDSKTFKATKTKKEAKDKYASYEKTSYFYIDTDGKKYDVYSHKLSRGPNAGQTSYYIFRVSGKTGNRYPKKVNINL